MTSTRYLSIGGQALPLIPPSINAGTSSAGTNNVDAAESGAADIEMTLSPVTFDFAYCDIRMRGRCNPGERHATLRIAGDVGPLPFSAESRDARAALQTIVETANAAFEDAGSSGAFRVTAGRIMLATERRLALPVSAVGLVTGIVSLLIPVKPYLDLVAEIIRPPLEAARPGESALRPEWRRMSARRAAI